MLTNKSELLYKSYLSIDSSAFHEVIRFYNENRHSISAIPYRMRLEILTDYAFALFETEDYRNFIILADALIEEVISENIYTHKGRDVYRDLLYLKASAHMQLNELQKTKYILNELLKIYPDDKKIKNVYILNEQNLLRSYTNDLKLVGIISIILSGFLLVSEWLVIGPFMEQYLNMAQVFRNAILILGVGLLLASEGIVRVKATRNMKKANNALK